MTARPRTYALGCLVLLLASCGEGANEAVEHLANAAELIAVEEWRVGSVDDPEVGFSRVGGVAVDAEGAAYVLESADRQVRVYDARGQLVRRIGRGGEGPGEFKTPMLIGIHQDTLALVDPDLGRVTLFHRSGELLETIPSPPVWLQPSPGLYMMVVPFGFTEAGYGSRVVRTMAPPQTSPDSFSVPHVTLNRAGRIADTIRFQKWSFHSPMVRSGGIDVRVPGAPSSDRLYFDGPAETYIVERPVAADEASASFTVTRVTQAGDTSYHRSFRYQPLRFSAAAVDSMVAGAIRPHLRKPQADSGAMAASVRQAMDLPQYQPPIVRGRLGADGVLWLQLSGEDTDPVTWILVDQDGRLRGRVPFPGDATIHWSSGDQVIAVLRDEVDVPWLIRYRLQDQE